MVKSERRQNLGRHRFNTWSMLARYWTDAGLWPQTTQQTQNICITVIQHRPNVFDVGPTFYKCYANILCLLVSELRRHKDHLLGFSWYNCRRGCRPGQTVTVSYPVPCWWTCPLRLSKCRKRQSCRSHLRGQIEIQMTSGFVKDQTRLRIWWK